MEAVPNKIQTQKRIEEKIIETHTEELIIGLCGPIGTDIHYVAEEIKATIIEKFNYDVEIIKLSSFIKKIKKFDDRKVKSRFDYHNDLISLGNELRSEKGNSVLAQLAINEIALKREELKLDHKDAHFTSKRICFIIDSIKNIDELELFRLVYLNLFYFIGVFSNLELREKNLEKGGLKKDEIFKLIDRDSGEEINNGQKVADTFAQADMFLRIDQSTSAKIANKINRFLNLIFNSDVVTPSSNETAMYQAFAAAGNSACLSRQVGASITNQNGEIISVGWNDVPRFNGSVYKFEETDPLGEKDFRCINLEGGKCFNDQEKEIIRINLIDQLVQGGVMKIEDMEKAHSIIKSSRIKELIEFSRAVHAEMHAIILASQKSGAQILGGKLFCTTFPCHNCARHIVAAGIREVYYIEPYRKSLALKLHDDSITENESNTEKLRILMFDGISPRRYLDFFKMAPNSRKESGIKKKWDKKKIYPKKTLSLQAIPILEKEIIKDLQSKNLIMIV